MSFSFVSSQHLVQCLITGYSLNSGPEGIRTPDLLSAIEARSQLRYRPDFKAKRILPEAFGNVNEEQRENAQFRRKLFVHGFYSFKAVSTACVIME